MMPRTRGGGRQLRAGAGALIPLLLAWVLSGAAPGPARAGSAAEGSAAAAGWTEETTGDFGPPAKKTVRAEQGALEAEFVLPPGRAVRWEKAGEWEIRAGEKADLALSCDRANLSSDDYKEGRARFPVSVTFVFGRDAVEAPPGKKGSRSIRRRIGRAFGGRGIRIQYALGSHAPAGSMYRLGDSRTVFLLAGGEEAGVSTASSRDLVEDFRAAYGRLPRGPVTKVVVAADRPSGEEGPMTGSVSVRLPFHF